jgi:hypothetical protein
MIKVSAGLSRKVGEANYSSRLGSAVVGPFPFDRLLWEECLGQLGLLRKLSRQWQKSVWNLNCCQGFKAVAKYSNIPVVSPGVG